MIFGTPGLDEDTLDALVRLAASEDDHVPGKAEAERRMAALVDACRTPAAEARTCSVTQSHGLYEILPGECVRECILYGRDCS